MGSFGSAATACRRSGTAPERRARLFAVPLAVHFIAESVVARIGFPADDARDKIDQIFSGAEAAVFHQPIVNDARQVMNVGFGAVKLFLRAVSEIP
jgi:hypothetical protein